VLDLDTSREVKDFFSAKEIWTGCKMQTGVNGARALLNRSEYMNLGDLLSRLLLLQLGVNVVTDLAFLLFDY
jgi:hypothetical protein